MSALNEAATKREAAALHTLDTHQFNARNGAHDVDDGILTADFVQVHLFNRHAVDARLLGSDHADDFECARLDALAECALAYHALDLRQGARMRLRAHDDIEL